VTTIEADAPSAPVVALPADRTLLVRGLALIGVLLVAYHYSLLSLLRSLDLETPLAYLGLVPLMALGIAIARRAPLDEPAIHDRHLDWIVGLPLVATAVAINLFLPHRLATQFWVWRMDLLSLPLFAAGAVALVLGTRALWRLRFPLGFLLLAWPLPYSVFLTSELDRFTSTTLWGIRQGLRVAAVAVPVPSGDGSLFQLGKLPGPTFQVSVASACSGVNGVVGFGLVAIAFMALVQGPRLRKALWLGIGLSLIWSINVLRILLIFWAGTRFGERVAIDGLHPYIGLVGFNLGVLAMVLLLRPFGLVLDPTLFRSGGRAAAEAARKAVPKVTAALAVVIAAALVLVPRNASLQRYDVVAGTLGEPRLAAFTEHPTSPIGWAVTKTNTYTWAKRFFGEDSSWYRYALSDGGRLGDLRSTGTVTADVIATSDRSRFTAYGVQACYQFHGYKLKGEKDVDLGGGVQGTALSYLNPKQKAIWTAVFWHWPVKIGGKTRYERVTLVLSGSASTGADPTPGASVGRSLGASGSSSADPSLKALSDPHLTENRDFLIGFAKELIARQVATARLAPAGAAAVQPTPVSNPARVPAGPSVGRNP
jgi:exosortase/archaeosortase family protein